jgi:drug/metabolite transporter (DMT)-like permease
MVVALISQAVGGTLLFVVIFAAGQAFPAAGFAWGMLAGACTGTALVLFYRGLATGNMAVVAPISGCGVIVPVVAAFVLGEPPGPQQTAGIALALAGIVLVSLPSGAAPAPAHEAPATPHRAVITMALGAAVGFGLFYLFVDRGTSAGGSALWVSGGVRAGSLPAILLITLASRTPVAVSRAALPLLALTGILDTSANALFAFATTHGNIGVVSVFASLYPVVTVLFAWLVTNERRTRRRVLGAALALAGVVTLSAA